jgi:hypothetical protein
MLYRGLPLHPVDGSDPYVFALDLSAVGMPQVRGAFSRDDAVGVTAAHVDLPGQPLTLFKRPSTRRSPVWPVAALGGLAVASVVASRRRPDPGRPRSGRR